MGKNPRICGRTQFRGQPDARMELGHQQPAVSVPRSAATVTRSSYTGEEKDLCALVWAERKQSELAVCRGHGSSLVLPAHYL